MAALLAVTRQTDGSGFLEPADCTVQLLTTGEFEVEINNLINTRQICTENYEKSLMRFMLVLTKIYISC